MAKSVLYMSMSLDGFITGPDYAGHWNGDHHGVPIFVPTRGTHLRCRVAS